MGLRENRRRKQSYSKLLSHGIEVHNAGADVENWEIAHGPFDYFWDENTDLVHKAKKGTFSSNQEAIASKKTESYPMKKFHPNTPAFSAGFVDKYSKDNPHVEKLNNTVAFHDALTRSHAEHFA